MGIGCKVRDKVLGSTSLPMGTSIGVNGTMILLSVRDNSFLLRATLTRDK